jgi:hypothetical protein
MTGGICLRQVHEKRRPEQSAIWETLRDFGWKKKKAGEATASMRKGWPCTFLVPAPPSKITTLVVPSFGLPPSMSRPPQPDNLSVSLEHHLIGILRPLLDTIPAPLSAELSPLLSETTSSSSSTPTIPYALLLSISRWTRTEEAARALRLKNPPLDPLAYNMVSLLAGTRTSPNKKFPQLSHSSDRSENARRNISDKKAIIAVLNALLSVICTGAATWWAAQRTGWRDEWVSLTLLRFVRPYTRY